MDEQTRAIGSPEEKAAARIEDGLKALADSIEKASKTIAFAIEKASKGDN